MKTKFTAVMLMLLATTTAFAIPARQVFRTITLPDGSTVNVMPAGDEFCHYFITEDGTAIDFDASGTLHRLSADSLVVRHQAARMRREAQVAGTIMKAPAKASSAPQYGMGLFTTNYPRKGDVRSLVLLVEYQDVRFRVPDPHTFFDDMLNKEGFSEYNATGSARDYFLEQSFGEFRPHFDVYGPVTLPNNMSYYGENRYGNDLRPEQMVLHAAEMLQDEIDFSQYDFDNNGQVDNIYVIYAGLGENSGGHSTSVWPHSYQIPNGPVYNGKTIYAYACSNEITDGKPEGIGTFCHEYSHVLGLPDLYGTVSTLSCTPKTWSIMDYGSYNNDSRTPPNYGIYERNALGWMEPVIAEGPESVELDAIHKSNRGYLIQTSSSNEFFLIENRQQDGWDTYIPGHGMLLWHIDFNQVKWDLNVVNNDRNHQYVDIVEAIGRTGDSNITLSGYPFPGTTGKTSVTAETSPALVDWSGRKIDMPITEIAETDGIITFNLLGGAIDVPTPEAPLLTAGEKGDVTATWEAVEGATHYLATFYTIENDGTAVPVGEYSDFNVGDTTEYTFTGLRSSTEYHCTIRACIGRNISEASDAATVTTPLIDFIYTAPRAIACEPAGAEAILSWEALDGAVKYLLTAEYEELDDDIETHLTFGEPDDTTVSVPEGWQWSEGADNGYYAISTGFIGESAPSLKFENNNASLTSGEFELDIKNVSFWLRGASVAASAKFNLQGRYSAKDDWRTIQLFDALNVYNSRGKTLSAAVPANIHQIQFVYTTSKGCLAFDDLVITTAGYVYQPIAEGLDVGATLSHSIDIPLAATGLRFSVTGVDGEGRRSLPSNRITIKLGTSGIVSDSGSHSIVSVHDNTLSFSGKPEDTVSVYTLTGALVTTLRADTSGSASVELPAGFYIAATSSGTSKIIIR